eukprot:IDg21055t1
MEDDTEQVIIASVADGDTQILNLIATDARAGVYGRQWSRTRNKRMWLSHCVMAPDFASSSSWRSLFRIPFHLFRG